MVSLIKPPDPSLTVEERGEAALSYAAGGLLGFLGPFLLLLFRKPSTSHVKNCLLDSLNWQAFASAIVLVVGFWLGIVSPFVLLGLNLCYSAFGAFASSRGSPFRFLTPVKLF